MKRAMFWQLNTLQVIVDYGDAKLSLSQFFFPASGQGHQIGSPEFFPSTIFDDSN
jgi:hypothetical protein